jgi:SSS family transporter
MAAPLTGASFLNGVSISARAALTQWPAAAQAALIQYGLPPVDILGGAMGLTALGNCAKMGKDGQLHHAVCPSASDPRWAAGKGDFINAFGITKYNCRCSFFSDPGVKRALPIGLGWFIVVGLGGLFAIFTAGLVFLGDRYSGHQTTSEEFSTAGRSIKVGLTACDIVSKWTWAATLLQSSNVAFQYGVSGPFWYASGATIQVLLFAVLAVEIKRKCPAIHTALEIVHARWGTPAHIIFLGFMFLTNLIVTSMLILGGSAVIFALSGVPTTAAAFLIPMGVTIYTAQGGLRATFIASWAHVAIIYIALCIFMFQIYSTDKMLGSPKAVWDHLNFMNGVVPLNGNHPNGTMLTIKSHDGLLFGIINIIGNFGTVFVDQAYWQGAIAAKPSATYKGYLLGGMCWFAIPFTLATTLGLAARAFDLPITLKESGSGLVPPAVASHTLGTGGAFLIVLQLFMAVTASGSAEQIAVASLFSYDIFKRYLKPNATGKDIILMSRIGVFGYGVISGLLATTLLQLGLNLGWVYNCMGILIGSAVVPLACALTWRNCSAAGAISGCVFALIAGIIAWVVEGKSASNQQYNVACLAAQANALAAGNSYVCGPVEGGWNKGGEVTYESLNLLNAQLAGNCASLFGSIFIVFPVSLLKPQNFDWKDLRTRTDANIIDAADNDDSAMLDEEGPESAAAMDQALSYTYKTGGALTLILIILWPCLTIPAGHFTASYWGWWVALAIIWGLLATISTILLPLWEARAVFVAIGKHLIHGELPSGHEASTHNLKHVPGTSMKGEKEVEMA